MKGFLKDYEGDITDYDYENHLLPHFNKFDQYMFNEIIPDITAYYIAIGYLEGNMFQHPLKLYITDMLARVNYDSDEVDVDKIKENVKKVLESKYGLITINENPLDFR